MNRLRKRGNWTAVPNAIIRDSSLSTNARCLWMILQSFSEDFVFRTEYVRDLLGVGRDSYRSAWSELEDRGLAVRIRSRDRSGSWVWDIDLDPAPHPCPEIQAMEPSPCPDLPATAEPATVEPATVKQGIYKEQEKEDLKKEDLGEEEAAASPGQWLADLMASVNIGLNPIQCDAIYMQVRAYMDEETAFRYLSIKSAELVAAGVKPRTMVRALVQDAAEYAKLLGSRAVGKNEFEDDEDDADPATIELDDDGEKLASMLNGAGMPDRQAREIVLFAAADGTLIGRARNIAGYLRACGEDQRIINTFAYGFEFAYKEAI